jgi:protein phosphatase
VLASNARGLAEDREEAYALVVADGIGGGPCGEVASALVVEAACAPELLEAARARAVGDSLPAASDDELGAYVGRIDARLREAFLADPRRRGMGSTLTAAYIAQGGALVIHAGDSRAYRLRNGRIEQITRDHTLAQLLRERGAGAAATARLRHLLLNAFGGNTGDVHADLSRITLDEGDSLLLCTDGLSNLVGDAEMAEIAGCDGDCQAACQTLLDTALRRGGNDNITVVLARRRAAAG